MIIPSSYGSVSHFAADVLLLYAIELPVQTFIGEIYLLMLLDGNNPFLAMGIRNSAPNE